MAKTGPRRKDLKGEKIGKLTAESYLEDGPRGRIWLWRCDCGGEVKAARQDLLFRSRRNVNPLNCGCQRK